MAPNKQLRSPFGLFMAKMKRLDPSLRSRHMSQLVGECNESYKRLAPEVAKQFHLLSGRAKSGSMTDQELFKCLDRIDIDGHNNMAANDTADDEDWDQLSPTADARDGRYFSANNNNNKTIKPIDTNFDYRSGRSMAADPKGDHSDDDYDKHHFEDVIQTEGLVEEWKSATIVAICFNVVVKDQDDNYYPNEVGVTQWSLNDGIFRRPYNRLIRCPVPSGYYSTAKEFADRTHKIPLNPTEEEYCRDYPKLAQELHELMAESSLRTRPESVCKGRQMVFCKPPDNRRGAEDRDQVRGCLKWLDSETGSKFLANFVVYELHDLLFSMSVRCCQLSRPKPLLLDQLNSCRYDYFTELCCDYHSERDLPDCAMGVTRRLAYLFLTGLLSLGLRPEYEVKPVIGQHMLADKKPETRESLVSWRQVPVNRYYHPTSGSAPAGGPVVSDTVATGLEGESPNTVRTGIGRGRRPLNTN